MPEFPETSESLIIGVRDPSNHAAWEQFEQRYRPVIFRIARSKGLQHSDALDLVQQVLVSVSSAIGRYTRPSDGTRFRNWLSRVIRNAILKSLTRGPHVPATGGSEVISLLHSVPAADAIDDLIEREYRRELYVRAAARVRKEVQEITWLAFETTVLQDVSVEAAAKRLSISTGSVYAARSRIMRRLQTAINELDEFEPEERDDQSV